MLFLSICFLILYITQYKTHLYFCIYESLKLYNSVRLHEETKEVGMLLLLCLTLILAFISLKYKIELKKQKIIPKEIDDIKSFEDKRFKVVSGLLSYSSKLKTQPSLFYTNEMAENLSMDHNDFVIIFKTLNGCYTYSSPVKDGFDRYEININKCVEIYSKYKENGIYTNEQRYKNNTINLAILMLAVATVQAWIAFLSLFP